MDQTVLGSIVFTISVVRLTSHARRFSSIVMLMTISFFVESQTLPEYTAQNGDSTKRYYNTFCIGVLTGQANLTYILKVNGDPIPATTTQLNNLFSGIGTGFSRSTQLGWEENLMYGVNAYVGRHQEKVSGAFTGTQVLTFYGFNPFIQYDREKMGMGFGIHIGNMSQIRSSYDWDDDNFSSVRRFAVFPSFNFRWGNLQKLFTEIKFANQFPASFPAQTFQLSLGFGLKHGGVLRLGTSSFSGFFVNPTIRIGDLFLVEPWLGIGSGINSYRRQSNLIGSVALHYKFNKNAK